jgi:hypothetical protein
VEILGWFIAEFGFLRIYKYLKFLALNIKRTLVSQNPDVLPNFESLKDLDNFSREEINLSYIVMLALEFKMEEIAM